MEHVAAGVTADPLADLSAAFNVSDSAERMTMLAHWLGDDAEVVTVHGESRGASQFADVIELIQRDYGPLVVELVGDRQVLGRWDRHAWILRHSDGSAFATGAFTARRDDDGHISHLLSLPDEQAQI